jgi:hypothetical protein
VHEKKVQYLEICEIDRRTSFPSLTLNSLLHLVILFLFRSSFWLSTLAQAMATNPLQLHLFPVFVAAIIVSALAGGRNAPLLVLHAAHWRMRLRVVLFRCGWFSRACLGHSAAAAFRAHSRWTPASSSEFCSNKAGLNARCAYAESSNMMHRSRCAFMKLRI